MVKGALVAALAGIALVAGCAKIMGIDDPGIPADGGVGQPCDPMTSQNPTNCGPGNVCPAPGTGAMAYVCAKECATSSDCPTGLNCVPITVAGGNNGMMQQTASACEPGQNGGGSGSGAGSSSGSGSSSGAEASAALAPMPMARGGVACAVGTDNKVYVFGGFDTNHSPTVDVLIYDPASNSWSTGVNMLTGRFAAGVALGQQNGTFIVTGGFVQGGMTTNDTEMFNAFMSPGGTWTPLSPMPTPVGAAGVAGIGLTYVAGGASAPTATAVGTLQTFQVGNQWSNQPLPPMPTPRKFLGAATPQGNLLTIGGFDSTGAASKSVELYSQGTNMWSTLAPMPTPRGKLAVAQGNNVVFALGGAENGALATLESYDPNNNMWSTLPPMPTPRAGLCAAWVKGNMGPGLLYAIGGDDGQTTAGTVYANVEAYDPNAMTWRQ